MEMGEYEVTGHREYRGHPPGAVFEARIDRAAEARAITRGDIRLIRVITPGVPDGWVLPDDWPPGQGSTPSKPRRRKAPLSLRKE